MSMHPQLPARLSVAAALLALGACGQPQPQAASDEVSTAANKITTSGSSAQSTEESASHEDIAAAGEPGASTPSHDTADGSAASPGKKPGKAATPLALGPAGKILIQGQKEISRPDQVGQISSILGNPDNQSESLCLMGEPPASGKSVTWGSLTVFVADESFDQGGREFPADQIIGYTYGVTARHIGTSQTLGGIGLRSALADVQRVYPAGQLDSVGTGSWFHVPDDGMVFEFDGSGNDATVVAIHSGFSCDVAN